MHLSNCAAGTEERPTAPNPDEPGWEQMCQLFCLTAPEPQRHPVWDEIGDGSQVVVDSFRLTFAECAARGAAAGSSCWEVGGAGMHNGAPMRLTCETGSGALTGPSQAHNPPALLLVACLQPACWTCCKTCTAEGWT